MIKRSEVTKRDSSICSGHPKSWTTLASLRIETGRPEFSVFAKKNFLQEAVSAVKGVFKRKRGQSAKKWLPFILTVMGLFVFLCNLGAFAGIPMVLGLVVVALRMLTPCSRLKRFENIRCYL